MSASFDKLLFLWTTRTIAFVYHVTYMFSTGVACVSNHNFWKTKHISYYHWMELIIEDQPPGLICITHHVYHVFVLQTCCHAWGHKYWVTFNIINSLILNVESMTEMCSITQCLYNVALNCWHVTLHDVVKQFKSNIMLSVFFKILMINTQYLVCEGKLWATFPAFQLCSTINSSSPSAPYIPWWTELVLVQIMACHHLVQGEMS